MSSGKNILTLQQIAVKINRMVLIGLFDLIIGILSIAAGMGAPAFITTIYGYGLLQIFGLLIGLFSIVAGILSLLSGIGIPIAIIAEVYPPLTSLRGMQFFAAAKGALCLISVILLFLGGTYTTYSMLYYLVLMLLDFGLAYYGGEVIRLILRYVPAPLKLRF
ncbi:MAG: hypothetical protein DRO23_07290 [Thermoprotei archaeon]|nr:MAG: hypothetical protein DRO23_07290 [Thermoprotei archaeon]